MTKLNVAIPPGKYVVAVSGGVDSVVLLDMLMTMLSPKTHNFVVAHFDHGIREDSSKDAMYVAKLSQKYGVKFEVRQGKLGPKSSEMQSRDARYSFLRQVRRKYNAVAIITAHHQDDQLETMILNMLRGTNRKGMASLGSNQEVLRPLLPYSKADLQTYAATHGLLWHEDISNTDTRYLRNYIRHKLLPRFTPEQKSTLLAAGEKSRALNLEIDSLLPTLLPQKEKSIARQLLTSLPHKVATEVVARWLKQHQINDVDKKMIEKVVVAAKTHASGKKLSLDGQHMLSITTEKISILQL